MKVLATALAVMALAFPARAAWAGDSSQPPVGGEEAKSPAPVSLQDVVVNRAFRRRGIGAEIIGTIVRELRARGVDWIGLVGQPGTRTFYERLGFGVMQDHLPMKLP